MLLNQVEKEYKYGLLGGVYLLMLIIAVIVFEAASYFGNPDTFKLTWGYTLFIFIILATASIYIGYSGHKRVKEALRLLSLVALE